jgi:hypothetical protein
VLHLHRPHIWRPSPRFAIPAKQKPRSNIPRLLLNVCGDRPGGFRSARPIQSCIDNQRAGVRFQKEEGRCGDFGSQIPTAAEMTEILGEALGYLRNDGLWPSSLD